MARAGPRKVRAYRREFKLTAVRLSQQPGMQVQAVAAALDTHPFKLSQWRTDVRDGALQGRGRGLRVAPEAWGAIGRAPVSAVQPAAAAHEGAQGVME
jgi:transposase-like protein